uniref:Uncharacterized protein n=1 Tax=Hordeum vulgare subsp. vulgare TaxID=112509 RepID=A0A8I6YVW4_HORVV
MGRCRECQPVQLQQKTEKQVNIKPDWNFCRAVRCREIHLICLESIYQKLQLQKGVEKYIFISI